MGRDRGRGKRGGRGGGRRSYIQNIDELKKREGGVDDEDEENSEGSEEEEEENLTEPKRAAAPDSVFNLRPSKSKVKNVDEDEDDDDEEERPSIHIPKNIIEVNNSDELILYFDYYDKYINTRHSFEIVCPATANS
jgi:hypothetical protein